MNLRNENPIILAIPRGGVVTGDVIAKELGAKLDIIVSYDYFYFVKFENYKIIHPFLLSRKEDFVQYAERNHLVSKEDNNGYPIEYFGLQEAIFTLFV